VWKKHSGQYGRVEDGTIGKGIFLMINAPNTGVETNASLIVN